MVLLKSLFLCYEGVMTQTQTQTQEAPKKKQKQKKSRKRDVDEISTDTLDKEDSLENSKIPTERPEFQKNLFHLIVIMMKSLQACCSKAEIKDSYEYIADVMDGKQLVALHEHTVQTQSEDDFLSFLSYFDYSVIDQIRPVLVWWNAE